MKPIKTQTTVRIRNGIGTQSDGDMFIVGTPKVVVRQDIPLYVHESIESPTDVVPIVDTLRQLEEGDLVTMYVSGVGGCVSSVDLLLHEMTAAQMRGVEIHAVCTGLSASAYTFIPLHATSFELSEGFNALIHCGSVGVGGTLAEAKASSAFTIKYMESRLRAIYKDFLSEQEIEDVLAGKDMWLTAEDWCTRFTERNERMEAMMQEAQCGEQLCEECSRDMYECSCGMTAENQIPVSPEKEAAIDKSLGIVRKPRKPSTKQKEE